MVDDVKGRDGMGYASYIETAIAVGCVVAIALPGHTAAAPPDRDSVLHELGIESSGTPPPAGLTPEIEKLWRGVQPTPSGDPFLDTWPAESTHRAAGEVIGRRDLTASTAMQLPIPIREAVQVRYATRDSAGAPSFTTATLLKPVDDWRGAGDRPVLVHALPINSLGLRCTPGYRTAHGGGGEMAGFNWIPPVTVKALARGFAVLVPDHEGPRMAYAEPRVTGQALLDGIRAARSAFGSEFDDSRYALFGYSGGGLAAYSAAMLLEEYAPELRSVIEGAALGGIMTDLRRVAELFDGHVQSGILMAVVLAFAREHPEILTAMNDLAKFGATSPLKDVCGTEEALLGAVGIPLELASKYEKPLDSALADKIFRATDLRGRKSAFPLYIFHAKNDQWVPASGAADLYKEQCALGVSATVQISPGEHITGSLTTFLGAMSWLNERLQGVPAPNGCPRR
ncbi:lipase family protein [Nocardia goodfellowii]